MIDEERNSELNASFIYVVLAWVRVLALYVCPTGQIQIWAHSDLVRFRFGHLHSNWYIALLGRSNPTGHIPHTVSNHAPRCPHPPRTLTQIESSCCYVDIDTIVAFSSDFTK